MKNFLQKLGHGALVTWEVLSFVLREVAGWLLVVGGVALLGYCVSLIGKNAPMQAALLTIPSVVVFRGGIHLLKVSVAARLALHARERSETTS